MYNLFFSDTFVLMKTPSRLLTWGTTQVLFVTMDMALSSAPEHKSHENEVAAEQISW